MNVLDYGCGEALDAARVADRCARLWLCEDAATVRARLTRRFADHPVVRVTDGRGVGSLGPNTLDVVIVNSVVQYLPAAEFDRLLHLWYDRLKPDGLLVLGDIVPPRTAWHGMPCHCFGWHAGKASCCLQSAT